MKRIFLPRIFLLLVFPALLRAGHTDFDVSTKRDAGNAVQYIVFNRAPGQGMHQGVPASLNTERFNEVLAHFPNRPELRVQTGLSFVFSPFRTPPEKTLDALRTFLDAAEQADTPVLVQIDFEHWWEARPDLWNWWDPERPGFERANRENVEWTGWSPEHAVKIAWRNWGRQIRVLPPPNLASPRYLAACREEIHRLVPVVLSWHERLPDGKKHLLIGVKLGHETSIGVNAYHYPGGNELLGRPPSDDPVERLQPDDVLARGMSQLGYAALSTSGIRTSGTPTEAELRDVAQRYLEILCREASEAGVPRELLFAHGAGWKDGELVYDVPVNAHACPGWSFYRHAADPRRDAGVQRNLARSDAPYWSATEWHFQGPRETAAWRDALSNTLADPRCRYVCIFNWEGRHGIRESGAILQAVAEVVEAGGRRAGQPAAGRAEATASATAASSPDSGATATDAAPAGAVYYVAPDGDDTAPGTRERPFRSLERARDAVRELKRHGNGLPPSGATIFLRGGIHLRTASFELTAADSGTPDTPIVYTSKPGETATLFGGRVLPRGAFTPVAAPAVLERVICTDARNRLLQCNLEAQGISEFGQLHRRGFAIPTPAPPPELFIDGQRMTLARYPNEGRLHIDRVTDKGPVRGDSDFNQRGGTFTYRDDRPTLWTRAEEVWLNGVFSKDWIWSFNKVAKIDPEAKAITLAYGEVDGLLNWRRDFFHAENLLEEIDVPGEYFVDRRAGILYVLPPDGFDDAHIAVSTLAAPMVRINDTKYVTFRRLVFDTSRHRAIAGSGRGVGIVACEFVRHGLGAVSLSGEGHQIRSCYIHRVGGTAIALNGGDWETLAPSGCVVDNCHIHHWGYWQRVYCPGVSLRGVGHVVRHNEFEHWPHNAIEVRGNDHLIENNLFHDGPTDFKDMGAIYANLGQAPHHRGTMVRQNFFRGVGSKLDKQNAVYPDNGTMDWRIEQNVFYRTGNVGENPMGAVFTNGGAYLIVRNNVFVDCASTFKASFFLATWAKTWVPRYEKAWRDVMEQYDFTALPHGRRYPGLLRLLEEDRMLPDTNVFERNLVWNPTVPRAHEAAFTTSGGPASLVRADGNYIATEDPGFVDWRAMNFNLHKDATVFDRILGFQPIAFDEIGLRGPVGPNMKR